MRTNQSGVKQSFADFRQGSWFYGASRWRNCKTIADKMVTLTRFDDLHRNNAVIPPSVAAIARAAESSDCVTSWASLSQRIPGWCDSIER